MFFFFSAHTLVLFLCASAAVRAVGRESKCSRRKGITTAAASAQQRRSVTAGWFGSYCCFLNAFETSGIKKKTRWDSWIPVSLSCVRFSHILVLIPASLCVLFFFRTPCWTWNSRWALRWGGGGEAVEKSSSVHLRQSKWTPEQPGLRRPSWSQFGSREGLYDGLAPLATCTSTCTWSHTASTAKNRPYFACN